MEQTNTSLVPKAKCHINTQPDTQIQTQEDSYTQEEIEFFDISNIKPERLTGETIPPGVKNKLGFTVCVVQFKSCLFVWTLCFLFRLLSRAWDTRRPVLHHALFMVWVCPYSLAWPTIWHRYVLLPHCAPLPVPHGKVCPQQTLYRSH